MTSAYPGLDPTDLERARIVPVRWLPPGASAMTFGSWILIRAEHLDDTDLVAHELVHVRQWREHGPLPFMARYVADYLRGRARGLGHWDAYRRVRFEIEARQIAGR